jgi:hypothetical protein
MRMIVGKNKKNVRLLGGHSQTDDDKSDEE